MRNATDMQEGGFKFCGLLSQIFRRVSAGYESMEGHGPPFCESGAGWTGRASRTASQFEGPTGSVVSVDSYVSSKKG